MTVRRAHVISSGCLIGHQRAAASTPIAPHAGLAALFLIGSKILKAATILLNNPQWIVSVNRGEGVANFGVTFRDSAMLIDNEIIASRRAGIVMGIAQIGLIDERAKQLTPGQHLLNSAKSRAHATDHLLIGELQIAQVERAGVFSVIAERKWHIALQNIGHERGQAV